MFRIPGWSALWGGPIPGLHYISYIGESISTHCFSKVVGNGSSEHDFDGEFIIIFLTSSTDAC